MSNKPENKEENKDIHKSRKVWKTLLRALGWTLLALVVLIIAAITVAVNYLKPERLTPLVERIANDNINGQLTLERVEISFYSTFPRFELDVRGLTAVTHAFRQLPDSVRTHLPAYADTLLSIRALNGAINIPAILAGKIQLYDTEITSPAINLVQATPDVWSLDIFPPSEEKEAEEATSLLIPDIRLATFGIRDGFPVRYVSLPDSIEASVTLTTTVIDGNRAPDYRLDIAGFTSASIPDITIRDLGIGLGGEICWDPRHPMKVALNDFVIRADSVTAGITTALDFSDGLLVENLKASLPQTPFSDIISLIPAGLRGELDKVRADFNIGTDIDLTRPFRIGTDSIPSFDISVMIPKGKVTYDGMNLDIIELDASASVNGNNLNRSTLDIRRLKAQGEGMGFLVVAKVTDPIADPHIKGSFKGGLSFAKLPAIILRQFPGTITGLLKANCDFNLRQSYLDKENFHRIRLTGDATLTGLDVDMPELPASLYSREMELKLGTNSSFTRMGATADSLLTASLRIDTISCELPGMTLRGNGLRMGVGTKNSAGSSDTSIINPIGGRIVAEKLMFRSDIDSVRVHLRKATVGASLTRYKGDTRKPLMHLDIGAERAMYGDRLNRAALGNAGAILTIHPSAPPALSRRRQARLDSLTATHPELPADSLRRMEARIYRERRRARMAMADTTEHEVIDMEVDNSIKKLLILWRAEGRLKAERMRLFSPLFPLRNRISDLNLTFNSDSVTVTDTRLNVGRSDFLVNGTVSNITRALTSSTGRQSLTANFNLTSDSIDINQIAGAVFAGAAFAEHDDGLIRIKAADDAGADESAIEHSVAMAAADSSTVLVVPYNIEANLNVDARNIIYSNLIFHDFKGVLSLYRGALNLSQLTAHTDVGSLGLNALYSAPSKHDATFAFGLNVNDFHIGEFLKLVPAIDTVMPLLQTIDGIINADIAATTAIDSTMNIDIPTLKAAVKISGDSLRVIDDETFRTIGKWLMFKHKERNVIDSMNVEMIVENSSLRLFPFMFNLDRYKLGVMGSNDMNMNFNYHVAVLKSPIPFKFGINISGNPDKMKIRLGGAKFNEKNMARTVSIADTTRINLVREIRNVFRRGVRNARIRGLNFSSAPEAGTLPPDGRNDTISRSDSLYFIKEGLIQAPDTVRAVIPAENGKSKKKKKK